MWLVVSRIAQATKITIKKQKIRNMDLLWSFELQLSRNFVYINR